MKWLVNRGQRITKQPDERPPAVARHGRLLHLRALARAHSLRPRLHDWRIPLDNNQTERALRGIVIGRKNHYGSRSLRGTRVAALFYSLIEPAKLGRVEPRAYLREVTRSAIARPGAVTLPRALLEA